MAIANGTTRKCHKGNHTIKHEDGAWFHTDKAHWVDSPHKAAPRKYKKKAA